MTLIERLQQEKLVAIMRGIPPEKVVPVTQALMDGGVKFVELTMDSEKAAVGIAKLRETFPDLHIGAGTVISPKLADEAIAAGAQYLISPNVDVSVIVAGVAKEVPVWPGALTPTEIVQAWEAGAGAVKLFPAGVMGLDYLKAVRGPLKHIPLLVTGGISALDASAYIKAGAVAVGMGGSLFDPEAIREENYAVITAKSEQLVTLLRSTD